MLVQIYEVSTPGEARAIAELGVDHVGVLVGDGRFPRELPIDIARDVIAAVVPPATQSVLLLAADLAFIAATVAALEPPIVHLGASPELLGPADVARLKARFPTVRFMRSVPVVGDQSLDLACAYDGIANLLLLDSHEPGDQQVGALGRTHDWTISRRIVGAVRTPVILAGGLGPGNVAAAMAAVRPAGVDSETRTDRNDGSHRKDLGSCANSCAAPNLRAFDGVVPAATTRVSRFFVVHDCGRVINPDGVKAQIEGSVIQTVYRVLREELTFRLLQCHIRLGLGQKMFLLGYAADLEMKATEMERRSQRLVTLTDWPGSQSAGTEPR